MRYNWLSAIQATSESTILIGSLFIGAKYDTEYTAQKIDEAVDRN